MVKLLKQAGCEVKYNTEQTCCGQLAFQAGYWKEASTIGEKFLHDFAKTNTVVCPSGTCVAHVRQYYKNLFFKTAYWEAYLSMRDRCFELTEFLVNQHRYTDFGAVLEGKAVYLDACQALRNCKIKAEPRLLLSKVKGLELIHGSDSEKCCGFGGDFSNQYETLSAKMATDKIEAALAVGAKYIISTDITCLMHLANHIKTKGYPIEPLHIADVLMSR
jgi:L-lactate dehydrogenase complex protein LldE